MGVTMRTIMFTAAVALIATGALAAGITGTENNNYNDNVANGGAGYGGSATNKNNISTEAKNANTNVSGASVRDSGNSRSRSTSSSDARVTKSGNSASISAVSGSGNSRQSQKQSQSQGNSQNLTIEGDEYKAAKVPVSTAYAPSFGTAASCLGAVSGGISSQFLGIAAGKTVLDEGCDRREDAKLVAQLVGQKEAIAVLCGKESLREAMGKKCPQALSVAAKPTEKPSSRKCQFPGEGNCAS